MTNNVYADTPKFRALVLWLLPLVVFGLLHWVTAFNGLYGQDPYEYLRYAQRLTAYWSTGELPGGFFWPVYYPLLGSIGSLLLGEELLVMQLISALACGGMAYCLYRTLADLYPDSQTHAWWYTLLWGSFSPFLLRAGVLVMADTLSIYFVMLFFWGYFRYATKELPQHILLVAGSGGLAIFTRYGSALLLLLPSLYLLVIILRRGHWRWLLGALIVLVVVAAPQFGLKEVHYTGQWWQHGFLQDWSVSHWVQRSFQHGGSMVSFRWPNLIFYTSYLFHPGYCLLGGVLLLLTVLGKLGTRFWLSGNRSNRSFQAKFWMLTGIVWYTLFLAGVTYQSHRYTLPAYLLMLILWYPAYLRLSNQQWWQQLKRVLIPIVILVQLGLLTYSLQPFLAANALERHVAAQLKNYPAEDLYTFYLDLALPVYGVPQRIHNLWQAPITTFEEGDLVLFNPDRFTESWSGHTLMENWNYLQDNYKLRVEQKLPEGWSLYRVETQQLR